MAKIKKICETCGCVFHVFPYRVNTARFCSGKCSTTTLKPGHKTWLKGTKGIAKPNSGSFKKGLVPWNLGKNTGPSWNKGKKVPSISGKNHPMWRGGIRHIEGYIYVFSPDHPNRSKQGYVAMHRLVVEKDIHRFLNADELVHHINEDKKDNRIENLMICSRKEHMDIHRK